MTEMDARRYLCSDLVVLKTAAGACTVNLEEIGENFAVFETEAPLELREQVCLEGGGGQFHGFVNSVEKHDFGWRVEIEFSPLTRWSPERFRPQHLFDPAVLLAKLE